MNIYISLDTFSATSELPARLLYAASEDIRMNPYGRTMTSLELGQEIQDTEVLIAGTEKITEEVLRNAPRLRLISRVGIGLDGIDFELCEKYGIAVTYTPDAPTMAVAELCVGMILDMAREISISDRYLKSRQWHRHMGMLLYGKTVGIMGMGRIGKSLVHLLKAFNVNFLAYDIDPDIAFGRLHKVDFVSKEAVLKQSDVVSINVPLKEDTKDFIKFSDLEMMKESAFLVNTARGGVVNENDLYAALIKNTIKAAAVDVFGKEPYQGKLTELDNCLLTCHIGASTVESRTDMELQAVEEILRFIQRKPLQNKVFKN